MTEKEKFESLILDRDVLSKHPNNHDRRKYIREIITNDLLIDLYLNEHMSANSIVKYFQEIGISIGGAGVIIDRLRNETGVETRNISDTCFLPSVSASKIKTIREKYGENITNISQSNIVKEQKRLKCLDTYGVDNNFKSPVIKQKIKDYWITNHGVEHPSEIPGFFRKTFRLSKPHRDTLQILDDLGVEYETETNEYFKSYNPIMERRFCPIVDIYIPNKKLVIEVNGCFWHANPKYYKPHDMFNTIHGKLTAEQIWQRDKIKEDHIINLNYNFETIWDDEINKERVEEILNKYENC
jgi:G:T-mismatch repair DNA endonuclease (very short patch repair protein)